MEIRLRIESRKFKIEKHRKTRKYAQGMRLKNLERERWRRSFLAYSCKDQYESNGSKIL